MAGKIEDGKALTEDGQNCFHGVPSLAALVPTFAGFASMCWENPEGAGVFNCEEANAACNSFAERASNIIWDRLYQHLYAVIEKASPAMSKEQIDVDIAVLVSGLDLWN